MWFDAQAALAKLREYRETEACDAATTATSATQRACLAIVAEVAAPVATTATSATPAQRPALNVAIVASVATPFGETSEALQLRDEALKDLDAATDVANILLERLRGSATSAAVASFLEVYQPAIDALAAHAAVRKIHIHNLADYKKEQFR